MEEKAILNTYDKAKEWLNNHCHRYYHMEDERDEEEFLILFKLIKRHPNYHTWKKKKPNAFHITRGKGNKALQLMVRFPPLSRNAKTNGKYRIVSWVACAKGKLAKRQKETSVDNQLTSAMRYAIRRQISIFRNRFGIKKCVLCGSTERIEVDHIRKFHVLRDEFKESQMLKGNPAPTKFKFHPKRGVSMFLNVDEKWKQAWQRYHNKNATYRFLCSDCNKRN